MKLTGLLGTLPLSIIFLTFVNCNEDLVVQTTYGAIKGRTLTSRHGRTFYSFTKIPFAKPPVGELRFQAPQKPSKHEGILDATQVADDCIQRNMLFNSYPLLPEVYNGSQIVGKEDCLYLNVYYPKLEVKRPLPVMFYVHGGGFEIGSGSPILHGPEFFMDKDVVLVETNYRLGPFGFVSLENEHLRGNMGLKDQIAALEWTKENIENFGGNPDSVTIFGESAGGASVSLLMASPLRKDLFHQAITQSGTKDCFWAVANPGKVKDATLKLAALLNCPVECPQEMIKCLRDVSPSDILLQLKEFSTGMLTMAFVPVLEDEHTGAAVTKAELEKPTKIPLMTGVTSGEGLLTIDGFLRGGDPDLKILNQIYRKVLPKMLEIRSDKGDEEDIIKDVKEFYLGDKDFSRKNIISAINMFSDAMFGYGNYKSAKKHQGKLYLYYYNHRGERSFSEFSKNGVDNLPSHADELFHMFYMKKLFPSIELNERDTVIVELLLNFWTNFATFGEPAPEGMDVEWHEAKDLEDYFNINAKDPKMERLPILKRMKLWEKVRGHDTQRDEL